MRSVERGSWREERPVVRPKFLFLDLDGTLVREFWNPDPTESTDNIWDAIASTLGESAKAAERKTKERWKVKGYPGYVDWAAHSVTIHQAHGLTRDLLRDIVIRMEAMPGLSKLMKVAQDLEMPSAIVSGGNSMAAEKFVVDFGIRFAISACRYIFDEQCGNIVKANLLPVADQGKVHCMNLLAAEHGCDLKQCVFVGDGSTDVDAARAAGLSIAFNSGSDQLREVSDHVVEQSDGNRSLEAVADILWERASIR